MRNKRTRQLARPLFARSLSVRRLLPDSRDQEQALVGLFFDPANPGSRIGKACTGRISDTLQPRHVLLRDSDVDHVLQCFGGLILRHHALLLSYGQGRPCCVRCTQKRKRDSPGQTGVIVGECRRRTKVVRELAQHGRLGRELSLSFCRLTEGDFRVGGTKSVELFEAHG